MGALEALLKKGRPVLVIHFLIFLIFLPGVFRLKTDNSPEIFFSRDVEALEQYREFRRNFKGGQGVRVAVSGPGLWTGPGLKWLGELEEKTTALTGVEAAVGLSAQYRWFMLEWPPENPGEFYNQVLKNELDLGAGWVSPDGDTVTMLAVFADAPQEAIRQTLGLLEDLVSNPPGGIIARISGLPVIHLAMDRSLIRVAGIFLPLLVLLAAVFLLVIFRSPRDVTLPLVFVALCQAVTFGVMGYLEVRINLVNIILSPLLFVISLATAVHILVRFRKQPHQAGGPREAVLATYRDKGRPVFWTGLTTLAAFGSLVFSGLPPVRSLGAWSAFAITIMTLLVFTFYPLLLAAGKKPGNPGHTAFSKPGRETGESAGPVGRPGAGFL